MGEILVVLFWIALLSGLATSNMAKKNGRNPVLWFVIGAALPVASVVIVRFVAQRKWRTS